MRQVVGPPVEFGVGQLAPITHHRDGVRNACNRCRHQLMQAGRGVVDDPGLVPGSLLIALLGGEQRQL